MAAGPPMVAGNHCERAIVNCSPSQSSNTAMTGKTRIKAPNPGVKDQIISTTCQNFQQTQTLSVNSYRPGILIDREIRMIYALVNSYWRDLGFESDPPKCPYRYPMAVTLLQRPRRSLLYVCVALFVSISGSLAQQSPPQDLPV